jgi:uncharacterized cupin superfamily protein
VKEAKLVRTETGLVPEGEGWYVLNASDGSWHRHPSFGTSCQFEGDVAFEQFGINVHVLQPGEPNCLYHRENLQEDFLILAGECLLLVEGQERRLRQWDFVHCPPWTDHVFVGAGEEACVILMVGARSPSEELVYPVSELAQHYGAGVETETPDPHEAYAPFGRGEDAPYHEGDLP